MIRGPFIPGLCFALSGLLSASASFAAQPPGLASGPGPVNEADPAALALDKAVRDLKEQALQIKAGVDADEQALLYPDQSRVEVYLSVPIPGLLVRSIDISVDGATPRHFQYKDDVSQHDAFALQQVGGGMQPLIKLNAAPGPHHITADAVARYAEGKPGQGSIGVHFEGLFAKDATGPADLELSLTRNSVVSSIVLKLREWSGSFQPGSDNDPDVRAAKFMGNIETGQYLSAASLLLQRQYEAPQRRLPVAYYQQLADATLDFGLPARARAIYREQAAKDRDPLEIAKLRLQLAQFLYDRSFFNDASDELLSLRQQLPKPLIVNWQDLMSRTFYAQGKYAQGVDVLNKLDNAADQTAFMRYNLAVGLILTGQVEQGATVLDRVSVRRVDDSETLALRDKANLALGYYWLRQKQGASAIPIFNRIRTVGPYSNRALLGLGWAYLTEEGDTHKRVAVEDEHVDLPSSSFSTIGALLRPGFVDSTLGNRTRLGNFKLDRVGPKEQIAFRHALVPWSELLTRDPLDPAVQECKLAVPYALDRLDAHIEALEFYEKAAQALEKTRGNLKYAIAAVKSDRMIEVMLARDPEAEKGWKWRLLDLPDLPETFYLQTALAAHPFQEALKNYRDIRLLNRNAVAESQRIDELSSAYAKRVAQTGSGAGGGLHQPIAPTTNGAPAGYQPQAPQLKLAQALGSSQTGPNGSSGGAQPLKLQIADQAPSFNGPNEQLQAYKARLNALIPKLQQAQKDGDALIKKISIDDLNAQMKVNEQYLVEARLALARIYDRAPHGDTP